MLRVVQKLTNRNGRNPFQKYNKHWQLQNCNSGAFQMHLPKEQYKLLKACLEHVFNKRTRFPMIKSFMINSIYKALKYQKFTLLPTLGTLSKDFFFQLGKHHGFM